MKSAICLIVFFMLSILGHSQHLLVYENMKNGKILAYKLPVKAMCKLKNGENKIVIIDSIQGDSVYCRLRNDKSIICISLSAIKKINNSNSEMNKLTLNLGLITLGTCILVGGTAFGIYYQKHLSTDPGDNLFGTLALLASPLTAAFVITNMYLSIKFLYTVSFDKWKFYGLKVK